MLEISTAFDIQSNTLAKETIVAAAKLGAFTGQHGRGRACPQSHS
jgi:hypothetical protein